MDRVRRDTDAARQYAAQQPPSLGIEHGQRSEAPRTGSMRASPPVPPAAIY
eukprot:gene2372-3171_t